MKKGRKKGDAGEDKQMKEGKKEDWERVKRGKERESGENRKEKQQKYAAHDLPHFLCS